MKPMMLEVCVDSMESALAAIRGGAMRLELCQDLIVGGTTPGLTLLQMIREVSDITIHPMIRPRFGDFHYSDFEIQWMERDIRNFVQAGAQGVVFGCLDVDGRLNQEQMKRLVDAADGRTVVLHRAFDVTADPFEALETAKELGVNVILTSGQEKDCLTGSHLLAQLVKEAGDDLTILAGAGVNASAIPKIFARTGITSYHMSGKVTKESPMIHRNPRVFMGMPGISEFEVWETSEENIRKAKEVLQSLSDYVNLTLLESNVDESIR